MYVRSFKEWATKQYIEGRAKSHLYYTIDTEERVCVCINTKTQKAAFAKCHPDDEFDSTIGVGVAYAKLMGREIPKERKVTELSNVKIGQHFFVNNKGYILTAISNQYNKLYICEEVGKSEPFYLHKCTLVTVEN